MSKRKVNKTIRLYKRHDLDLITFLDTHNMDFKKAVYCALTAFSKREAFVIKIPPKKKSTAHFKKKYEFHLLLDKEKDQAVIRMLDEIKEGYRNSFIKNVLRLYLCTPISEEYLIDKSNIDKYEQRFAIFKEGRRVADAAKVKSLSVGRRKAGAVEEDRLANIFDTQKEENAYQQNMEAPSKSELSKIKEDPILKENERSRVQKAEPGSEITQTKDTEYEIHQKEEVSDSRQEQDFVSDEEDLTDLFSSLILT